MEKKKCMYRITFVHHPFEGDDYWNVDRILVSYADLFKMIDNVMVHYPESVSEGKFIKFEEVVF